MSEIESNVPEAGRNYIQRVNIMVLLEAKTDRESQIRHIYTTVRTDVPRNQANIIFSHVSPAALELLEDYQRYTKEVGAIERLIAKVMYTPGIPAAIGQTLTMPGNTINIGAKAYAITSIGHRYTEKLRKLEWTFSMVRIGGPHQVFDGPSIEDDTLPRPRLAREAIGQMMADEPPTV